MNIFTTGAVDLANRLLAQFQAILQRMYPRGHIRTRRTHELNVRYFCDFLAGNGVQKIREITKRNVSRYVGHLRRCLKDGDINQRTAKNRLNSVNEVLRALFLSKRCHISPTTAFGKSRQVRTRPIREVSEDQLWNALEAVLKQKHESCAIFLFAWWMLGVRFQESLGADFRRILAEAREHGYVRIKEMSKGNAAEYVERQVKIRSKNNKFMKMLELAAKLQADRNNLIPPGMSRQRLEQQIRKQYDKIRKKLNLPNPHEFRAGYACWFYHDLTGIEAPIAYDVYKVPRDVDRAARNEVSKALGHRRESVASAYLGGVRSVSWQNEKQIVHTAEMVAMKTKDDTLKQEELMSYSTGTWIPCEGIPELLCGTESSQNKTEHHEMRVRIEMENLLCVRVSGTKSVRAANVEIGKKIAMAIDERYKVMPRAYKLHHLTWYVDNILAKMMRHEAERYFSVISTVVLKIGMEKHWIRTLELHLRRVCEACRWVAIERVVWFRKSPE